VVSTRARDALSALFFAGLLLAGAYAWAAGPPAPAHLVDLGPAPLADPASLPVAPLAPVSRGIGLVVDTSNRQQVVNLFNTVYTPALAVPGNWNGSTASCNPGTVSPTFGSATVQMINYYRAMTGLPADLSEDVGASAKADDAALMMKANNALSHSPPSSWACYTAAGAEAAGHSNLAGGAAGAFAVTLYIWDFGDGNYPLGHRRWLLYPPLAAVGRGDTDTFNALWVLPTSQHPIWGPRPTSPEWVRWPPAGYVPYQVTYPRWSLSHNPNVDFSAATVSMTVNGSPVSVNVRPLVNNYGDRTLVWEPSGITMGAGMADKVAAVTVNNILIGGVPTSVSYNVIIIDPAGTAGPTPTPTRTPTRTPTPTPTRTPTRTPTPSITPTASTTPTPSRTPTLGPHPLDADGNQSTTALEDGLLGLRFLFGFDGSQLTDDVVGQGCTRCDPDSIVSYLSWLGGVLDVDGNGEADPLTDGVLITRYLFGFRGALLTSGAIGQHCSRCSAGAIESYLSDQI
jgi:hypothetical protein